jgi:hypothetical protein
MQVSNNTLRNIWANKTQPVDTLSLPVGWVDGWAGNRTSQSMKLFEILKEIKIVGLSNRIKYVYRTYFAKSSNFTLTVPPPQSTYFY